MTVGTRSAKVTLPADDQILITREFDAPRELVWRAYTTPELVAQWWHANRGEVKEISIDFRVGGRWRHAMEARGFGEVAFNGEYLEIVPNEKLVSTELFEGAPAEYPQTPTVNTATFVEENGRTTLTILVQAPSKDVRDAIIASGMEDGLQDALALLEQLAQSLR